MKLIFIHGSGGMRESWYYQTKHFKESEAVALPGHPQGKVCSSVEGYTEWLRGYIWAKGYRDVILAGHSLGGAIVQLYGLNYPEELKGLILVGTGARLRVATQYLSELEEAIKGNDAAWKETMRANYSLVAPEVRELIIEKRTIVGPAVQLNDFLCCDKFDVMNRVSEIKLPTLVLCGAEDIMTPVKYAQYLANKIQGAKQVVIEGATHAVPLEKPKEVNRAIEEFVEGL